jgi:hypothetical protein
MRRASSLIMLSSLSLLAPVTPASGADDHFPPVSELPARAELPDPLIMFNGDRIQTREQWLQQRRPELKALFQYYMYGYFPPAPERPTVHKELEDDHCFAGKATLKQLTLSFGPSNVEKIRLLLVVPNARKGPAPVFVGMNFCGNHALVSADIPIPLPTSWIYAHFPGVVNNRATDASRGAQIDVWALEQSIDRGYAVATFYSGDIDPDRSEVREGIQPEMEKRGLVKPGPHAWGTIAAWAWGIERAVDYLCTDPAIDRQRIAVVGHSRLGKTALLAAAFDDRIALAIPHQAGCGGSAPSRSHDARAESVKQINTHFPHWFCGAFKDFNEQPDRLPFDQNCLVALCAPRPVLFSNASEDLWANPAGQFQVLRAAEPVYHLLGAGGLEARAMPQPGRLIDSTLGYYIRPGQHSMTRGDWKVFLDYADRHFGRPRGK